MARPFLLTLILLTLFGCSDGVSPKEAPPTRLPPDTPRAREYPVNGRSGYCEGIARFFKHHPDAHPSASQMALINRHLELAQEHYDEVLGQSRVRIFEPGRLSDAELLATSLDGSMTPLAGALDQEHDFDLGPIHYQVRPAPYAFRAHEAFVLFSGTRIGEGLLGPCLAPEELGLLETNFMPCVADVLRDNRRGARFAPDLSLKNLDSQPAVLGVERFLELGPQNPRESRSEPGSGASIELKPLSQPMDIYLTAMAAKPFPASGADQRYAEKDVEAMVLLATRGFFDTLRAQHHDNHPLVIHTGNWGWSSGNARATIWAIQRVALEVAYQHFSQAVGQTYPLAFHYDAQDLDGLRAANEAHNALAAAWHGPRTVAEWVHTIFERTQTDPAWQAVPVPSLRPIPPSTYFCSPEEVDALIYRHHLRSLDQSLYTFLTDPYASPSPPKDMASRLEKVFGSLGLRPLAQNRAGRADAKFLLEIQDAYREELHALTAQSWRVGEPQRHRLLSTTAETILTSEQINTLLYRAGHDPRKLELLRRVIYHCLSNLDPLKARSA